MIEPEAWTAVSWHTNYSRLKVLPFGGTDLMKQPAYVYEAIKATDDAFVEIESEAAEKRRAEDAAAKMEADRAEIERKMRERNEGRR